jgi:hypothetical protein
VVPSLFSQQHLGFDSDQVLFTRKLIAHKRIRRLNLRELGANGSPNRPPVIEVAWRHGHKSSGSLNGLKKRTFQHTGHSAKVQLSIKRFDSAFAVVYFSARATAH